MTDQEERKVHENTSSSYLSLKAELLRKQQDLNRATTSSGSTPSSSFILDHLQASSSSLKLKVKADLDVETATSSKKRKRDEEEKRSPSPSSSSNSKYSREEEIAFAKSRAILEAKAKLYEQIMSNGEMRVLAEDDGNEDDDKAFLVDFERKIFEANVPPPKIEYTDNFGRTRLVTPEEYQRLREADRKESPERRTSTSVEHEIERVERAHREKMRSKWEAEMEELRNKTNVHYQDVLFDEKRDHGVGYYQFSTDDEKRADQMATLNELRNRTKMEQMKFQQNQIERQSAVSERLNKMRMRKAKEMGIKLGEQEKPIEPTDTASIETASAPAVPTVENTEAPQPAPPMENTSEVPVAPPNEQRPVTTTAPIMVRTAPTDNPNMAYPFPVLRAARGNNAPSSSHS